MGTASTTKLLKQVSGVLTEVSALTTSAGAGDAQAIPALNASGVLDASIINGKNTSAGAGDAAKVPLLNASGILDDTIINASVTSSANKIPKLNGSGLLDLTVMPNGIGPDTSIIVASEALAAGDWVDVWSNAGTANVRKADASTTGKQADGFVLAAVASAANATVYFSGTNTAVTGQTPGKVFLSATTAGLGTATAPTGAGKTVQKIGTAVSATAVKFEPAEPITLA